MKGTEQYNKTIRDRTEKLLDKHPEHKSIVKSYLNYLGTDKSLNTKYQYARECIRFLDWSNEDVSFVGVDTYTEYFSQFEDKTPAYRMMVYAALAGFSEYLYDTGKNSDHPMAKVKPPKQIEKQETVEKREHGFLTEQEIKLFISNIKNGVGNTLAHAKQDQWRPRDIFLLSFMISNGPRVSAVAKMDVADIKEEDGMTYIVTTEKRGKVRKYYLSDEVRMLLEEYLIFREEFLDGVEEDALFISNTKGRITAQSIYNLVKKYSEDFKRISPHKLRATFGTQLYKQSHDIYFVQQNMGHSNPATTGLYVRGEKEDLQKKGSSMMSGLIFL